MAKIYHVEVTSRGFVVRYVSGRTCTYKEAPESVKSWLKWNRPELLPVEQPEEQPEEKPVEQPEQAPEQTEQAPEQPEQTEQLPEPLQLPATTEQPEQPEPSRAQKVSSIFWAMAGKALDIAYILLGWWDLFLIRLPYLLELAWPYVLRAAKLTARAAWWSIVMAAVALEWVGPKLLALGKMAAQWMTAFMIIAYAAIPRR